MHLKTVGLPAVPREQCIAESDILFRPSITPDKFCAGYLNQNIGICQGDFASFAPRKRFSYWILNIFSGDSGGGLVIPSIQNGDVAWYIRGIAGVGARKFETNSCDTDKYSAFTNILYYDDFITINDKRYRPRWGKYYFMIYSQLYTHWPKILKYESKYPQELNLPNRKTWYKNMKYWILQWHQVKNSHRYFHKNW